MANDVSAPPINPLISIQPLTTPQSERDTVSVSKALLNLAHGTLVEGFVVNRDGQNNPVLRTPMGDILVTSDFFIKTGSVVIFRVDTSQATRARILSVDGQTPAEYVANQPRALAGDTVEATKLSTASPLLASAMQASGEAATLPTVQAILLNKSPQQGLTALVNAAMLGDADSVMPLLLNRLQTGASLTMAIARMNLPTATTNQSALPTNTTQQMTAAPPQRSTAMPTATSSSPQTTTSSATLSGGIQPVRQPTTAPANSIAANAPSQTTAALPKGATPLAPANTATVTSRPSETTQPLIQPSTQMPNTPSATAPQSVLTPPQTTTASPASVAQPNFSAAAATQATEPAPYVSPADPMPVATPTRATQPYAAATASSLYAATARHSPHTPLSAGSTTPAAAPPYSPASLPERAATISATVIGQEPDGATVLQTRHATFKTYLPQPLPTGTELHITLTPNAREAIHPHLSPIDDTLGATASILNDWETLSKMVAWAEQSQPLIARTVLSQLPQVDTKLTSGLLFFLSAIKGGDIQQFFGNHLVRALEIKAPDFLKKLKQDVQHMQHMLDENLGQSWASTILPMVYQGELHQARLFYRQDEENAVGASEGGSAHRFIVEVGLSALGDMQFDGFVRDGKAKRVFDLVIRSARPLTDSMRNDMRRLFDDALQTTGYQGYLTFQQGAHLFVRPMAAMKPNDSDSQTILA